jgi:DNA polymerase-3 subunit delta
MATAAVKPVYALVGPDAFLQSQAVLEPIGRLPKDIQRSDFDGETAELRDVLDELRSFAMFGGGRLVIVREADEFISRHRSALEDYVAAPSDGSTLVLRVDSLPSNQRLYKAIQSNGQVIACQPPKDLAGWAVNRGKTNHGIDLSREGARLLVEQIGADLGRIDMELGKLGLISDSGRVGEREVADSVAFQRERQMWDMTDALSEGDVAGALLRWRQLIQLDSSAEFRAVTWLGLWLENSRKALALLAQGANTFSIGQQLRIWPQERQAKFVASVQRMGEAGIARATRFLAEIDFQTKTGVGDAAENVERFLLGTGASR